MCDNLCYLFGINRYKISLKGYYLFSICEICFCYYFKMAYKGTTSPYSILINNLSIYHIIYKISLICKVEYISIKYYPDITAPRRILHDPLAIWNAPTSPKIPRLTDRPNPPRPARSAPRLIWSQITGFLHNIILI